MGREEGGKTAVRIKINKLNKQNYKNKQKETTARIY